MRNLVRILVFSAAVALFALTAVAPALAYDESTSTIPATSEANCGNCHDPYFSAGSGVHGGYAATTSKCEECHSVHEVLAGGAILLPAATIQATCFTCHDGTQGRGVYGAIAARGLTVASEHRVEVTSLVPGGNAATGGSTTMDFGGLSDSLTCTNCHSPHGSNVVVAYQGDRKRSVEDSPPVTTHALKQSPGGTTTVITEYGSDWCLACHGGRAQGESGVHNHPVDFGTGAYTYGNVAILTTEAPTSVTVMGPLGYSNRGYLMPWDSVTTTRTLLQRNHYPICQQCHEDARDVGTLSVGGDTGDAAAFVISLDGTVTAGNPRFQNFPHESTNVKFLVETTDNLCRNCHPCEQLP
ncbi:MAG: cytochrome c3 family protein [Coriobacteriia bacterium]|nr:cytochrome c3 family protein [Coriobacteriia bacterium]